MGNSPINFTDPTGHRPIIDEDEYGNPILDPDWPPRRKRKVDDRRGGHQEGPGEVIGGNDGGGDDEIVENKQKKRCHTYNPCSIDERPSGWQVQIDFPAGIPTNTYVYREKVSPLFYYGLSLVFDFDGGIQLFGITRDINFSPTLNQGPAEKAYPTEIFTMSGTVSTGPIYGKGFAEEYGGTNNFARRSVTSMVDFVVLSFDWYEAFDETTGKTNPDWVRGWDIGVGPGLTFGQVATYAHPLTRRFDFTP